MNESAVGPPSPLSIQAHPSKSQALAGYAREEAAGLPRDAARIAVVPGTYRARISYGSLDKLSTDGLDGEDHYLVQLWPGTATVRCATGPCAQYSSSRRPCALLSFSGRK